MDTERLTAVMNSLVRDADLGKRFADTLVQPTGGPFFIVAAITRNTTNEVVYLDKPITAGNFKSLSEVSGDPRYS